MAAKRKKRNYKSIHLWDPIFRTNVYVVIGGPSNGREVSDYLKGVFGIERECGEGAFAGRAITVDDGMNAHIFIKKGLKKPEFHAVLAHEAFHAAHYALSLRGQKNDSEEGEESHAYYIGWIVRETLTELWKRP